VHLNIMENTLNATCLHIQRLSTSQSDHVVFDEACLVVRVMQACGRENGLLVYNEAGEGGHI
jgi:hypothetical protein